MSESSKPRTFKLNKLVRDKIINAHIDEGGSVSSINISGNRLNSELIKKLQEEAKELKNSKLSIEELADLQEILDQLLKNLGISKKEIKLVQKKKNIKKGGFKKGHFIKTVTLPTASKWTEYYAAEPKRFPEVLNE